MAEADDEIARIKERHAAIRRTIEFDALLGEVVSLDSATLNQVGLTPVFADSRGRLWCVAERGTVKRIA